MRSGNLQEVYALLTGEEKRIVDGSGFFPAGAETACGPSRTAHPADEAPESSDVRKLRRRWKAELLKTPVFDEPFSGVFSHLFGGGGNIYVWLDSCCFGHSRKKGFYYVRYQLSMLAWGSTAYAHPVLIVEKNKLRPDQVEYMERKCLETRKEARNRAS
ncbi:MAG: hypothetical protein J6331_09520 [Lentisphaeria bacterium]|nr:hypothetical protein [Lentisphaeria bacterium]